MKLKTILRLRPIQVIKERNKAYIKIIFIAGLFFSCSHRKAIMRNHDINIIVLNRHAYQVDFRTIMSNINLSSFDDVIGKMKNVIGGKNESVGRGGNFSFDQLYDTDTLIDLKKSAFEEESEKYGKYQTDSALKAKLDIGILQPILFFTALEHFNDRFYLDLAYHPPIELSSIFSLFFQEYGKAQSSLIEIINPFEPMAKDLAEKGGIYYVLLKPELLKALKNELEKKEQTLKKNEVKDQDRIFLNEIFKNGILGESMIVMQITP